MMEKLEENVTEFLKECAKEIGRFEENIFGENTFCECLEHGKDARMESPIEQILYIALKTVKQLNFIEDWDEYVIPEGARWRGLDIQSQIKIGKYRCDFRIVFMSREETYKILVECDSQKFHERNEKERRYEKARDRFFVKQGYKVFHYTGSEILKRPLKIAKEILEFVTKNTELEIDSNTPEVENV